MFTSLFILLTSCETKKICLTTESSDWSCYDGISITNVDSSTDLSTKISESISEADTDISISLSGSFEYDFPLNLFNDKKVAIKFSSSSSGKFDTSNINNIDVTLDGSSGYSNINVNLYGTSINDIQSSLTLNQITITSDSTEIQLKAFVTNSKSTIPFTKITCNKFDFTGSSNAEITISDNDIDIDNKQISITGENPNVSVTLSSSYSLIINNQATNSIVSYFCFKSIKSITFNGNDFVDTNKFYFTECYQIITNIGLIAISSITMPSSSYSTYDFQINPQKDLNIKGLIALTSTNNLKINKANDPAIRNKVNIESLTLNTGKIQLVSSLIDLTIDSFLFGSETLPIIPCVGLEGTSTITANQVTYSGSNSLTFNSIKINLDFTGDQSDETLSTLMSQDWNIATFKSFTTAPAVEKFGEVTFNPNTIYGFKDDSTVLTVKSLVSDDYVVSIHVDSFSTIPMLLCYTDSSSCSEGTIVNDLSTLPDIIPAGQKIINLTIKKNVDALDLSTLKTTGSMFTIALSGYTYYSIGSIKLSESTENAPIDHLIFNKITFGTGSFQLNAKEITFTESKVSSSTPEITINEQSVVNTDTTSLQALIAYITGSLPLTNINGIASSDIRSFEIKDDVYFFEDSNGMNLYSYMTTEKLPKVVFNVKVGSFFSNDFSFTYKISKATIDHVGFKFLPQSSSSSDGQITVTFSDLDKIVKANKISIDFGDFKNGIIDLNNSPLQSYLEFIGEDIQINNQGVGSNSNFCACKEKPCSECSEGSVQILYDELTQKISQVTEEKVQITIVGSNDDSVPVLSLTAADNKDTMITGAGTNPKIQIDCTTSFTNEEKTLEFYSITITAKSPENNLKLTNLKLNQDVIVDSSFNENQMTVDSLNCDVSQLALKSILVSKSLVLTGNAADSSSNTKVSFSSSSTFAYVLPNSITINECKLVFNNLEFDLTNVSPAFSMSSETTDFNIIGNNGNIDGIAKDITFEKSNTLNSVHFSGTWTNEHPSKFIVFNELASDLYLKSENIPLTAYITNFKKIVLEKETVSVRGKITLKGDMFSSTKYSISSSLTEKTTFIVNEIGSASNTVYLEFSTSNIDIVIDTLISESSWDQIKFYLLLEPTSENTVRVINKIDSPQFQYNIRCIVNGNLEDQNIIDFISKNHTLIVLHDESTVRSPSSDSLTFESNIPVINSKNFNIVVDENCLIFYTIKNPFEADIELYYGSCISSSCPGQEITNNDFSNIENIIQVKNSNVTIVFYNTISADVFLDLSKEGVSINLLTLKKYQFSTDDLINIPIKFGSSVSNLYAEKVTMTVQENDDFVIQNVTLKESLFSSPSNYAHLNTLTVDKSSILSSGITEFSNEINIIINTASYLSIDFTKTGIKIIDTYTTEKSIELNVEKFPHANIRMTESNSPTINLEDGVTELHQVNSFVIDSSTIYLGTNWNQLTSSSLVKYTLSKSESEIQVVTSSFPFESWELMYKSTIGFASSLSPYTFSNQLVLDNKNIAFTTSVPNTFGEYTITFEDVLMSGDSSISRVSSSSTQGKLNINKLLVQKGTANVDNAFLISEITIEPEGVMNGQFTIDENLETLNIEWDLNKIALFSPSSLQTNAPQTINVIYKGSSIDEKIDEFNSFLSNGVVIMKNLDLTKVNNIHFKSENVNQFCDGDKLALEIKTINDNEIQLVLTKTLSENDDQSNSQIESSLEIESSSGEESSSEEEISSSNEEISSSDEEVISSSDDEISSSNEEISSSDEEVISSSDDEISSSNEEMSSSNEEVISSSDDDISSSNEEISSSNEEISSSNEEVISSSDDEISSSNEEMSSSNEEEISSSDDEISSSNEEMSSSNEEEMSSSDDEISSSNEEISSSNEEMSSSNEEEISSSYDEISSSDDEISSSNEEISSSIIEEISSSNEIEVSSSIVEDVSSSDEEISSSNNEEVTSNDEQLTSSEKEESISSDLNIPEESSSEEIIPIPVKYAPIIDDSFSSSGSTILFTEKGYNDNDKFISTENNKKDILLIQSEKSHINIATSQSGKPNSALFVSPKEKNAIITISSPTDGSDNYGTGEFGVHANSNNPTINLPQTKVPLNIFSNQESTIDIKLTNNNDKIRLLESSSTQIQLKKLTISGGELQMKVSKETTGISFEEVETYLNGSFNALSDYEQTEILIGSLSLYHYSNIQSSNVYFNESIEINSHSSIEITNKARFSGITKIELSESSFIEFGQSEIEGICKEIRINKEKSINQLEDEIEVKLICGANFDCSSWKQKYIEDDLYKYAKCSRNSNNNEMCLIASNKAEPSAKKKSLSGGAIAGIIIAVIVVVAVIVGIVVWKKKTGRVGYDQGFSANEDSIDL